MAKEISRLKRIRLVHDDIMRSLQDSGLIRVKPARVVFLEVKKVE